VKNELERMWKEVVVDEYETLFRHLCLPKKMLWTNPGGQRGRGRPKSRWIDRVEKDARKLGCRN